MEPDLRSVAGELVEGFLAGRSLPADLPPGVRSALAAGQAREFLDSLAVLYEVRAWNYERVRAAWLLGALRGWRPETRVIETPTSIRILSPGCPIAGDVERDPRACAFCREFQEHVAREALPGMIESVAFPQLASQGAGVCEQVITWRKASTPAPRTPRA